MAQERILNIGSHRFTRVKSTIDKLIKQRLTTPEAN